MDERIQQLVEGLGIGGNKLRGRLEELFAPIEDPPEFDAPFLEVEVRLQDDLRTGSIELESFQVFCTEAAIDLAPTELPSEFEELIGRRRYLHGKVSYHALHQILDHPAVLEVSPDSRVKPTEKEES